MSSPEYTHNKIQSELVSENQALREEIEEARETIRALRNGEVDALVVTGQNGVEIRTLQGSEKLAASVFEQATEAILVCDSSGQIIRASKAAHDLCHRNPLLQGFDSTFPLFTQLSGQPRNVLRPTKFAEINESTKEKPMRGIEVQYECTSGDTHHLLLSASPWIGMADEYLGCVIILTDFTVLKNIERLLAKAAEDAQQRSKAREDFIAILAHELRNPLAPIRNSIAVMRAIETQDPRLCQVFDIVDRQVTTVVRMIDDLLDVARLERGNLNLNKQPVSLRPLVSHAVEICSPLIKHDRREITISLPVDELILDADPIRVEQVISNVLGNAIKFTREGGHIWISAERVNHSAVLRIKDDGVGVSKEMLPKIFAMFSQDEHSKSKGGLGIGLALVTQILRLHGGDITASSPGIGMGTEFVLRLPLSQKPIETQINSPSYEKKQTSRKVLIVEDNTDSRDALALLLTLWGHQLECAENGQRGIDLAIATKPDIAFIDVNLPDMSGHQVARKIRDHFKEKIVLVALTGGGQPADFSRTKAAGFDKHLVKPALLDDLQHVFSQL